MAITLRLGLVGTSGSSQRQKLLTFPRSLCSVALYLLDFTEAASFKGVGCSVIDSGLYGIRWGHKFTGLESASQRPTVIAAAEDDKRKLAKPVQPKQPLELCIFGRVAQFFNTASVSLVNIPFLFVPLV